MGNLFAFIFLTFSSFSFIFFKTEKAIHRGGAFGGSGGQVTNGAPWHGAPLLVQLVMAHHSHGAPLLTFFAPPDRVFRFKKIKENDGNVKK